jgi:hypothetical protein
MLKRINQLIAIAVIAMVMATSTPAFAAQTALTIIPLKENNYSVLAGDLAITFTVCDNVNGNAFTSTGKEILLVQNSDGAGAHTFTVTSVPDAIGRSDSSLTGYSVPLNGFTAINVNTLAGWKQNTGQIFLACNSALIKFAVIQLQH